MTEPWEGLVIVGMGNPLLSNDGVGRHAAVSLGSAFSGARVETIPMIGMDLLDLIIGHESLVIVDAVANGADPVGKVTRFQMPDQGVHTASSHGPDLHLVLALGRSLGLPIPRTIHIYGIEIGTEVPYGETLSPELQARFKTAVESIATDMRTILGSQGSFATPEMRA
jgi:hydrogenase maturation protease